MKRTAGVAVALGTSLLAGCAAVVGDSRTNFVGFESTYQRVLARAEQGDVASQNAVGYMLFLGDGVVRDAPKALLWFERAAEAGDTRARRNLAFIGAGAPAAGRQGAAPPLRGKAEMPHRGEVSYVRFCGGCHGVRGIAAYENSPSFAFGERLDKADADLWRSLLDGRQEMPGWEGKLPNVELAQILAYVRTLPARYEAGIGATAAPASDYMYLFGKMEERRQGRLR